MTFKDKLLIIFFNVITLGLINIYWKNKKTQKKEYLSYSTKIPFNLNELFQNLGGRENINNTSYTQNKIRFDLLNINLINKQQIENLKGISGVVLSSASITLIVGNVAKTIFEEINNSN